MNATPCDTKLDAIAAWVLGDLVGLGPEAVAIRDHLAGCEPCRGYEAGLRSTAEAIRADVPAPSSRRVAGVLAAVRREVGFARPAAPVPTPTGGFAGMLGAAAAAALLIGLALPRESGEIETGQPASMRHTGGEVREAADGTIRRVDPRTGRIETFQKWANATVAGFRADGQLDAGTLTVEFPDTYSGPRGPVEVQTPGGVVTVAARRGARYTLIQEPGSGAVKAGLTKGQGNTVGGDTGAVTIAQALAELAPLAGFRVDIDPASGADRAHTRLTVSDGVSVGTCLALLIADAKAAGIAITTATDGSLRVQRERAVEGPAPLAPAVRREGDLYVEVRGTGIATVEAAATGERFTARAGTTVMLVGRSFGRWDLPDHGQERQLVHRVRVRGVGAGGQVAVLALDGADPIPVGAGDDVYGYRVEHISAAGVALTRDGALIRIQLEEAR